MKQFVAIALAVATGIVLAALILSAIDLIGDEDGETMGETITVEQSTPTSDEDCERWYADC